MALAMFIIALTVGMVEIPGGEYRPLYMKKDSPLTAVGDFMIDRVPVSNNDFYLFTQARSNWSKGAILSLFAEITYLDHWVERKNGWQPLPAQSQHGVVNVSWFAANAYCKDQGKRLPNVAEWEYVARASETNLNGSQDATYNQTILDWYAKPTAPRDVGQMPANFWGINDLHGLNWEWTEDFNSTLTSGESRADSSVNTELYCAAAAAGSTDPSDYAAFMRYGFRSSLSARFTISNLGFRCAEDKPGDKPT